METTTKKDYPGWVCYECGIHASRGKMRLIMTYHAGTCGVCGERKDVTEPRDFFYPDFEGHSRGRMA